MYKCEAHGYQLNEICKVCGKKTKEIKSSKFSLDDKHGKQRRQEKFK